MADRSRRRGGLLSSLHSRVVGLTVALTLLGALATGVLGAVTISRLEDNAARRVVRGLADSEAASASAAAGSGSSATGSGGGPASLPDLKALSIASATVRAPGTSSGDLAGDALARRALSRAQFVQLVGGRSLSVRTEVDGSDVLVEARPVPGGGIVLAERATDTAALAGSTLPAFLWVAAAVAVVAAGLGLLLAWTVSRPLRRLAEATARLAGGERTVQVPDDGPSEVAAVGREMNALSSALARSEARQRDFLLGVSHDLRTPLTTITGYAEALSADDAEGEVREAGTVMLGEARRLDRMIGDLLDLARLEADELVLHPVDVDVLATAQATARAWAASASAQGVSVLVDGPSRWAWVDPQRLRQVLDSLVGNAVRVCGSGPDAVLPDRRHVVLRVRPTASGSPTMLDVLDDGPGLSDDDLAEAFDRGVLTERYRDSRPVGTGLGLALVDRLVRRCGGTVVAGHAAEVSDDGLVAGIPLTGARFTITVPVADPGRTAREDENTART